MDLPAKYRISGRIWPLLCSGQRRYRFESGRSGQRVLGRHERLLRATAGSAQYTDPRSVAGQSVVTGLLPYPNSLVGNGIGAIFPSWATPMNQMWNANIQRSIAKNLLVEVAYIGSRGEHIWNNFTRNATFPQYLSLGSQLTTWFRTLSSARSPPEL